MVGLLLIIRCAWISRACSSCCRWWEWVYWETPARPATAQGSWCNCDFSHPRLRQDYLGKNQTSSFPLFNTYCKIRLQYLHCLCFIINVLIIITTEIVLTDCTSVFAWKHHSFYRNALFLIEIVKRILLLAQNQWLLFMSVGWTCFCIMCLFYKGSIQIDGCVYICTAEATLLIIIIRALIAMNLLL